VTRGLLGGTLALLLAAALCPATAGAGVGNTLLGLQRSGAISAGAYAQDLHIYVAAQRAMGHLTGTRRGELSAVVENVRAMAAAGELTPSRLPAVFLTLERNRQWWTRERLLSDGARTSFPGSRLVWQYYAGQGLQIQWLGTFGAANGYYLSGHENANLRQLLGEALPLAARRAGGIAWEYLFSFDGGAPPWTSGLSQGTALQVLARAWSRFKDPEYLSAARQALGVFATHPPQGVRVPTHAGALYAEYSYAPQDRILNGFIQALVGLYDYSSLTKDPRGAALFQAGDAEARAEVPRYDTGAWSRYDQFSESTLGYHELLTEFLEHLCQRTRKGPPLSPAGPATSAIAGDAIYCSTAARFQADLRTPPVIALLTSSVGAGTRAGVQVSLSKVSNVSMTIRQGSAVVWRSSATVEAGRPRLLWVTPQRPGTYSAIFTATDPAGNFATAKGTIVVRG
jgi:D-glucuronyl C5-epimerase C-terminus